MTPSGKRPPTLSELIDRVEMLREELLLIQQSLEKRETIVRTKKKKPRYRNYANRVAQAVKV